MLFSANFPVVAHQGRSKAKEMVVGEIDEVFFFSVHGQGGQTGDAFHQVINIGVGQPGITDRCLPLYFNSHTVTLKVLFYSVLIHFTEVLPSNCRFYI